MKDKRLEKYVTVAFDPETVDRLQLAADRETEGNRSVWIRQAVRKQLDTQADKRQTEAKQ